MVISCNSKRPIIGLVNEFIFLVRNYPTEVSRVNDSDFLPDNFRLTQIGDSRNTSKYAVHEESQTLSFDVDDLIRCLLAAEIFD
jgi:hypothetical protein